MIYTHVAAAILAAAIAATGAWKVQDWRYNAKEKERAEQQLESERLRAKANLRNAENVIAAQNAAASRISQLRLDAAGARATADGLRTSISTALSRADNDLAACTDTANSIGKLLDQCGTAYQELGAVADRHASDIKTLIDAWPR